jgi:hypothetical protein
MSQSKSSCSDYPRRAHTWAHVHTCDVNTFTPGYSTHTDILSRENIRSISSQNFASYPGCQGAQEDSGRIVPITRLWRTGLLQLRYAITQVNYRDLDSPRPHTYRQIRVMYLLRPNRRHAYLGSKDRLEGKTLFGQSELAESSQKMSATPYTLFESG